MVQELDFDVFYLVLIILHQTNVVNGCGYQLSHWTAWGSCTVTCGGGNQTRSRSCCDSMSTPCTSSTDYASQSCNNGCCPVDGSWGTWLEWYACPVTCGMGSQSRYRYCNDPLVYCGGAVCPDCGGSFCSDSVQRDTDNQTCNDLPCDVCSNREIGYGVPSLYILNLDSNSGYGVLAESGFYEAQCCGIIKKWEFYASRSGEINLMVWRKSDTTYTLVGKNIYTVPSSGVSYVITYSPGELDRLSVMDGDMIGWYTPGQEIIPYSSSDPQNFRKTPMSSIEEGNEYDWSSVVFTHNRAYAIRVTTDDNTAPFFTNLDREVVIFDDEPSGSSIYKVEYYNGDTRDSLTLTYTSSNTDFSFNTLTEFIYLTTTPTVGTYTMVFNLQDSCGNVASPETLTIKVYNSPPRITSLPCSIVLHEDVKEGQLLHTLEVYDRQTTDIITCSLTSETPSNGDFSVEQIGGTSDYGIYLQPNPAFAYTTNKKHTLVISCTDGKNTAVTGDFFVHLQKNHPPRFVNLPASVELNVTATLIGDFVYNVKMTDDENDTLIFSMSTEPSGGPFQIYDYGDILTTANLKTIFTPGYDLKISVNDGRTTVGTRSLSVRLTNINYKPVISNLPLPQPFLIEENTALGTTIYRVRVHDLDAGDNHLIYGAFVPTSGSSYLQMSTDGYLKISADIDFESIASTSYQVIVIVTDNKDTASATISLTITDENEVPSFHQTQYSVEQDEAQQNTAFPAAGFIINDPDTSESFTYWLDCGNDTWRFTMSSSTGIVTYAYDYDLDKIVTPQYDCLVRAKDTGFNTCTTSLVIKIKDVNDNAPYFNQTQYVFYITPYENVGTDIGNVTAYDIDITEYGRITYQLDMTAYTELYIQITENGTLYVNKPLSTRFKYGDVMDLDLTAIDLGGLSTTVKVWIVFPEQNTTTTSTTPLPIKFTTSPSNTLWFTAVGILVSALFIGSMYLSARYCTINGCTRTLKKQVMAQETDESKASTDSKKANKMKSVNVQRAPGNPIFTKVSNQQNSLQDAQDSSFRRNVFENPLKDPENMSRNTTPEVKNADVNSHDETTASVLTFQKSNVNNNLYKAKDLENSTSSPRSVEF